MQEQLHELEQLRSERQKLLAIHQELQTLHDRFTVVLFLVFTQFSLLFLNNIVI
jgi:hypothetical protein